MLLLLGIIALAITAPRKTAFAIEGWTPPEFCGSLPCPEYTVWQKRPEFEARRYTPAVWLHTVMPGVWNYDAAVLNASTRLWRYFWGANEDGLRMVETVPLTVSFR